MTRTKIKVFYVKVDKDELEEKVNSFMDGKLIVNIHLNDEKLIVEYKEIH
jgi:hypothetical protein